MENNCAVYQIRNLVNDKIYIGQTRNPSNREYEHFWNLEKGTHHNKHLQASFNEHGRESFVFEILEMCCLEDLNKKEIEYIALLSVINPKYGFNKNLGGNNSSCSDLYRRVLLYGPDGKFVREFINAAECGRFLKLEREPSGAIIDSLSSPTKTVAGGYYVREYFEGYPQELDIQRLRQLLQLKRKNAGSLARISKDFQKGGYMNLLTTEEVGLMIRGNLVEDNYQNHGIDLNVISINKLLGGGSIPGVGKTILGGSENLVPIKEQDSYFWNLEPGTYDVTFSQGCSIPNFAMLFIKQRSSLLRNGGIINSSIFDAGFETENIGTVMILSLPVKIEVGARIACIYGHRTKPVTKTYSGQWQNDNQRKS